MKNVIIIPTYNERENVEIIIRKIFDVLPSASVVIVDDNSPDGTAGEVRRLKKSFPNLDLILRPRKEGLGKAYVEAFEKILKEKEPDRIITMDCDLSHDPLNLPGMIKISENFDLVIGSRYIAGGRTEGWELWRRILSRSGNFYCKTVTRMPINDCTSGFNVINAGTLRKVDFSNFDLSGYAFLVELKYSLLKEGGLSIEVPILFKNRIGGESKISSHIISEGLMAPWKLRSKKKANPPCLTCNSKNVLPFTEKNGFNLYKCRECGLVFVWPLPDSTRNIYSSNYFSGAQNGFGYADYDDDKQAMIPAFNSFLDKIRTLSGKNRLSLLDVGAATGFFLNVAKEQGYDVCGVEVSEWASREGRRKGLDIRTGTLSEINFEQNNFDAVTFIDVIEHLPDPKKEIDAARKILRKGGLLLINTPDAGSMYAKLMGKRWHSLVPPEHLIYFNEKNLSRILNTSGFEVVFRGKVAKKFTVQYCFRIAANWIKLGFLNTIAEKLKQTNMGKMNIPLNLRDNFLVIARKI